MNRLRTLSRDYLLPLLIGALVLRALIPVGFMPGVAGLSLTAELCTTPATGNAGTEVIEIPGAGDPMSAMHCDHCLVPVIAAASSLPAPALPAKIALERIPSDVEAPASRFALQRAQIPRAPPLA